MRRAVFAALAILAIVLVAFLSNRSVREPVPSEPEISRSDPEHPFPEPDVRSASRPPVVPRGSWGIRGTVYQGGLVASARIELASLDGIDSRLDEPPAAGLGTTSGADGRFSLGGLAAGDYELRATVASGVRAAIRVHAGARPWVEVEVDVPDGSQVLVGRATHEDGTPFGGRIGAILIDESGEHRSRLPETELERDGGFTLRGLTPGLVRLTARIPGSLWIVGPAWRVPASREVEFIVDAGAPLLHGRVLGDEDDAPLAGALARSSESGHGPTLGSRESMVHRVLTDADGRFAIHVGDRRASVSLNGFRSSYVKRPPGGGEAVVRLKRRVRPDPADFFGSLRGRVLEAEGGAPIPGAVVHARRSARTDANGAFAIEHVVGTIPVYVLGGGWVSPELTVRKGLPLDLLRVEIPKTVAVEKDLVAVRMARVRGTVTDSTGAPASDMTLEATWGTPPRELEIWRQIHGESRRVVVGVEDGSFVVVNLIPGMPYFLRLVGITGMSIATKRVTLSAGEEREVAFVCPPDRCWTVRVQIEGTGEPVVGARLICGDLRARTDEAGTARIGPLPRESVRIEIDHPRIVAPREGVVLTAADLSPVIRVPRGHVVGGVVLIPEGDPAGGAEVGVSGHGEGGWFDDGAYAAADGSFRVSGFPLTDKVSLEATWVCDGRRFSGHMVGRLDHEDHRLVLRPEVPVARKEYVVTVLGPDGALVTRGVVRRWSLAGNVQTEFRRREIHVDGEGIARHAAREEDQRVWFEVVRARSADGASAAPAFLGPIEADSGVVTVSLVRSVSLSGKVLDDRGTPVPGVVIKARPVWPGFSRCRDVPPHGEAATASDGSFTLGDLAAIEYDLTMTVPTSHGQPDPVRVRGGTVGLAIKAPRAATPTIRVLDLTGKPIPTAWVRVSRERRRISEGETNEAGLAKPERLDPTMGYRLEIRAADHVDLFLDDWRPADATYRLPRDRPVSGVVHDSRGPVKGRVYVYYRVPGLEEWAWKYSKEDGSFLLTEIPGGPVEIRGVRSGGGRGLDEAASVTVEAGATDVVLRIR